jgi:hypothetical protein
MGHTSETGSEFSPETFRFDLLRENLGGTLHTIFESGAAVSQDGNSVYYAVNDLKFPDKEQALFDQGRIFSILPQNLNILVSPNSSVTSKLHVIPPDSLRHLTFHVGKRGGISNYLLHGVDEKGHAIVDYLGNDHGVDAALKALARKRMIGLGIDPTTFRPGQVVRELLLGFANQPLGGLGEHYQAIDRMREEWKVQKQTAEAVEEFIKNGNH